MVGGLGCSNWAENSIVEDGNGLQAELLVEFIALTAATNTRATQTKECILEVRRLKGRVIWKLRAARAIFSLSLDGIEWKNTGKGVLVTILYLNRT